MWYHHIQVGDWTSEPCEGWNLPVWRLCKDFFPEKMGGFTVLDIGCAEGFYSWECAKRGAIVTALENDPEMHQRIYTVASMMPPEVTKRIEFLDRDAEGCVGELGHFSVSLLLNILHHLRDPKAFLYDVCHRTRSLILANGHKQRVELKPRKRNTWKMSVGLVHDVLGNSGFVTTELGEYRPGRVLIIGEK